MFIKTDNQNNIVAYPYSLDQFRAENTNRSLPKFLNNRFLATQNVYPVYPAEKPEYDEITQFLARENTPHRVEGEWKIAWIIKNKTQEEINQYEDRISTEVRKERDRLLSETDWVSIRASDTGETVDPVWAAYRQLLRDITKQENFPHSVIWPEVPTI